MANEIIASVRDLAQVRWVGNHPHGAAYSKILKMTDTEVMGIVRTANTVAGARRMAATWAKWQTNASHRLADRHDEEERVLRNELAGGLSIKRMFA
jgi:hypothetical protein